MKKIFIADIFEDQVIIQVGQKCYFDTINSFYLDYKKCDFGDIKYLEHNFSANKIIINNTFENTDPFEPLILDILSNIDDILDKQNIRRNPPPATLEEARELKLEELARVTAGFEDNLNKDMYFTSSLGFRVNGDRRTRSNIEDLIRFSPAFPVQYRDYDNQVQEVTREQLQAMLAEHITNGNNLYNQKWNFEAQINACTTIEEVGALKIEFEMMDFGKSNIPRLKAEALTDYVIRKYMGKR